MDEKLPTVRSESGRMRLRAVGHFERTDPRTGPGRLIENDLRGDTEAGVGEGVVEDLWISAAGRGGHAVRADAAGR